VSQISIGHDHAENGHGAGHHAIEPQVAARAQLKPELVRCERGAFKMLSAGLMFIGVLAIILTVVIGFGAKEAGKQALSAYHTGVIYCIGLCLGCLGAQMVFQQFNAGWTAAIRRQAENVSSLIWVCAILFVPVIVNAYYSGDEFKLFGWMSPEHTAGDVLFQKKAVWLNLDFWTVRTAVYFFLWTFLALTLAKWSRRQDENGDRWLTAKARKLSAFGLLAYFLTSAFASFDWIMSLDYHWFSTMFGVYFFAGCALSAVALLIMIHAMLLNSGKLKGIVTSEHFHDMGKLLFAFTVFWAYVSFSQYFLIWYSNIPEETAFFNLRQTGDWLTIAKVLCVGHFIVPFLVVLFRPVKRSPRLLMLAALWMLVMHALDLFFIIRPNLREIALGERLHLDVIGIVGPLFLFLGLVLRKVVSAPLIPLKDPRLHEALAHKNYV
jgi:hypothetical protein